MSPGVGLLRNTLGRLSFRSSKECSRPIMERSKTMGREEVQKVKALKLSPTPAQNKNKDTGSNRQNKQTSKIENISKSRDPVSRLTMTRSNSILGVGDLRSMALPSATRVCRDCKQMLTDKTEAMKRGESLEHRS